MKIYFGYIFVNLLKVFMPAAAIFASLWFGVDILFRLAEIYASFSLTPAEMIEFFLLSLPQVIVYILPMSTLLAVLMVYSSLSRNREIMALRAGGFSLHRIIIPALLLGVLISAIGIGLNAFVVNRANYRYSRLVYSLEAEGEERISQSDFFLTPVTGGGNPDFFLYASHFEAEDGLLVDVILQQFVNGSPELLIKAEEALWQGEDLQFASGKIYHLDGKEVIKHSFSEFTLEGAAEISIGAAADSEMPDKDLEEMSLGELSEHIESLEQQGGNASSEKVAWHQRLSIPVAGLIFALIAAPLGLKQWDSSGISAGFGLSIVLIIIYYTLMTFGDVMGSQGMIPPWLGAWLQNIIFIVPGIILVYSSGRR